VVQIIPISPFVPSRTSGKWAFKTVSFSNLLEAQAWMLPLLVTKFSGGVVENGETVGS
jgi:hypothetical protein